MKLLSQLRAFFSVARWLNRRYTGIVIDRFRDDRSKVAILRRDLIQLGVRESQISYLLDDKISLPSQIFNLLSAAAVTLRKVCQKRNGSVSNNSELVVELLAALIGSRITDDSVYIVISDLSQFRLGAWRGFLSFNQKIVWYQHALDMIDVPLFAPKIHGAILRNKAGEKFLCDTSFYAIPKDFPQVWLPQISLRKVGQFNPNSFRIGFGLGAWFEGSDQQLSLINLLTRNYGLGKSAVVSFHPRTPGAVRLKALSIKEVSLSGVESLKECVDVVFCGNTQLQIDLIISGISVVHIKGLDELGYDKMRYVKRGLIFGIEDGVEFKSDKLFEFYSEPGWARRFDSLVSQPEIKDRASQRELLEILGVE